MYRIIMGLVLVGLTVPGWGFGFNGHKAFCEAAYELTAPHTQQRLDQIIKEQGKYQSFAEACTWPDDIKHEAAWEHTSPWHYVNFPRQAKQLTMADCPDDGCVLSAIPAANQRLHHDPADWQALFFLSHFVGDIHQPLHVSYADDLGGNRAPITFMKHETQLHGLWDYGMLEQLGAKHWQQFGHQLAQQAPAQPQSMQPLKWANESATLTRKIYASYRQSKNVGSDYLEHFGPLLMQRMALGARRLATLLDNIYTPQSSH